MSNKRKKKAKNDSEIWTEEELANYLGFEFIAGYTEGGAPYGIEKGCDESESNNEALYEEELPF